MIHSIIRLLAPRHARRKEETDRHNLAHFARTAAKIAELGDHPDAADDAARAHEMMKDIGLKGCFGAMWRGAQEARKRGDDPEAAAMTVALRIHKLHR